jgi:hypothetical protein
LAQKETSTISGCIELLHGPLKFEKLKKESKSHGWHIPPVCERMRVVRAMAGRLILRLHRMVIMHALYLNGKTLCI